MEKLSRDARKHAWKEEQEKVEETKQKKSNVSMSCGEMYRKKEEVK